MLLVVFSSIVMAQTAQDELYINQLNYKRNKLEIMVKTRTVAESNSYSSTDWTSTRYKMADQYSENNGNITTNSGTQAETKQITTWKVVRGGIRELSDSDFLDIVGQHDEAAKIKSQEDTKDQYRFAGTITSVAGVIYMLWASGQDKGTAAVTTGGIVTAIGFLVSAFNSGHGHYITSDYAQELVDNYNIDLKRKLNLPVDYN